MKLAGFLQYVKSEVGLTDQEQIQRMFAMFCNQVGPVPVAIAARASLLTATMGEKLLMLHMKDREKARRIAESLNKKFFNHGYPVSKREANAEIGLPIADSSETVHDLMWKIWLDIEEELQVRKRFNPIFQMNTDTDASNALFGHVLQANSPVNLPQLMQLINNIQATQNAGSTAKGILESLTTKVKAVDVKLTTAIMESVRKGSYELLTAKILASRLPDLNIRAHVVPVNSAWLNVDF